MVTKQVTLPSGATAEIRRIGRVAGNRVQAMIQRVTPPALRKHDLSAGLNEALAEQIMDQIGEQAFEAFREAIADAQVETVCACATINGEKITPDTIDDHLDVRDFYALDVEIKKLKVEQEDNTVPFSKTESAS